MARGSRSRTCSQQSARTCSMSAVEGPSALPLTAMLTATSGYECYQSDLGQVQQHLRVPSGMLAKLSRGQSQQTILQARSQLTMMLLSSPMRQPPLPPHACTSSLRNHRQHLLPRSGGRVRPRPLGGSSPAMSPVSGRTLRSTDRQRLGSRLASQTRGGGTRNEAKAIGADGEAEQTVAPQVMQMTESKVSQALRSNYCHGNHRTHLHGHLHQSDRSRLQGSIGPSIRTEKTCGGTTKGRWVVGLSLTQKRRSVHTTTDRLTRRVAKVRRRC